MPDDEEYKIGYQKPPKETQFKKGQSGNPKGRKKKPKPSPTFKYGLANTLNTKIEVGDKMYYPAELAMRSLTAKAIKGDLAAIKTIFMLMQEINAEEAVRKRKTGVLAVPVKLDPDIEALVAFRQQAQFRGHDPETIAKLEAPFAHIFDPIKKIM